MGMRILKNYVIREHFKPFLLGLSVFAFILFMGNMSKLVKMVFLHGVGILPVLKLSLYLVPFIASYSLPMAVLLAVLLVCGRLSSDNEISAIKSSGINPVCLMTPVILLSLLISLFCVKLNDSVLPKSTYAARKLIASIGTRQPSMFFPQRTLIETFPNYVIYIRKVKKNRFYGIHISEMREEGLPSSIVAREGELLFDSGENTMTLKLLNCTIDQANPDESRQYHRSILNEYCIPLKLPSQESHAFSKRPKDMTIEELKKKAAELKKKKINTIPLVTEINKKLSFAFASLSFALIAIPLGLRVRKGSRSTGFGLSLLLIIAYYMLFTGCQALGEKGVIPPIFIWLPNIGLSTAGIILIFKLK